ncbi:MAG: serine/threonine protein kinase [Kofleriaceae bacterium]|nr:serine/threonine protein kinase [Kofleriaceae bacterium]
MDVAAFNQASAQIALGILALCAAMFALAWALDRRPADGLFAIQAVGAAIAFPGLPLGFAAPFGRLELPLNLAVTALTAAGAVEFTRVHLGRAAPPRLVRAATLAALVLIAVVTAAGPSTRIAAATSMVVSWMCIVYAIVAHRPYLRGPRAVDAWVLLAAWNLVALGSAPRTLRFLDLADLGHGIDPLPLAAAMFAALHAFVLVGERVRAQRTAEALGHSLGHKLATIEAQARELEALDAELRRQIRKRAEDLAAGAGRLLAALRGPPQGPPAIGETIDGRYRLEALLGKGGMGVVYAARAGDVAPVALKLLRTVPDAADAARFAREARLAAQVRHPNVVRLHDLGLTDDGLMFLVLELVDGPSLGELAPTTSPAQALAIAGGIADGLAAIHELGIVHRDLKPSNVLVARGVTPKITDFGIAALGDRQRLLDTQSTAASQLAAITDTREALGTPLYMAPEQARLGVEPATSADVFALGLVLFELLVGRRAFTAPPVFAPAELDASARDELRARAGDDVAATIVACLALAPAARLTAARVAEQLAAAAARRA